jgi:hypothetical protein
VLQSETTVFDLVMKVRLTQCGGQADATAGNLNIDVTIVDNTTTVDLHIRV